MSSSIWKPFRCHLGRVYSFDPLRLSTTGYECLAPCENARKAEPEKEPACRIVADVKNLQEQIQADTNDQLDFDNVAPCQVLMLQFLKTSDGGRRVSSAQHLQVLLTFLNPKF